MLAGSLDLYDEVVSCYVAQTGVPFLSVGLRLAPEAPSTAMAEDSFSGLCWLASHAGDLGVDPARIAVMGDSGGWVTLLGDEIGGETVSPITAPARLADFTGLAPAYIDVGDLDIFRDESIAYAAGLASAGVPVELHLHPGAPHGFERFVPDSRVAQRAMADRARAVATI